MYFSVYRCTAVAALAFGSTHKRPPAQGISSIIPGTQSPLKKHLDSRLSPQCRSVTINATPIDMDIDEVQFGVFDALEMPSSQPRNGSAIPRVSLSPTAPTAAPPPPPSRSIPKPKKAASYGEVHPQWNMGSVFVVVFFESPFWPKFRSAEFGILSSS